MVTGMNKKKYHYIIPDLLGHGMLLSARSNASSVNSHRSDYIRAGRSPSPEHLAYDVDTHLFFLFRCVVLSINYSRATPVLTSQFQRCHSTPQRSLSRDWSRHGQHSGHRTCCEVCQVTRVKRRLVFTACHCALDSRRKWRHCHWSHCPITRANKWRRSTSCKIFSIHTAIHCSTTNSCARFVARSSVNIALFVRDTVQHLLYNYWPIIFSRAAYHSFRSQRQAWGRRLCTLTVTMHHLTRV